MNDNINLRLPEKIPVIEKDTRDSGFSMASNHQTGSLLRTLVATKRKGRILELGTGIGISTCWLLDGMDQDSKLTTVDNDPTNVAIAKKHLSNDKRVTFHIQEGSEFLRGQTEEKVDFIFADTWPGKYKDLNLALDLLDDGGMYIIDDMLPQDNWPENHPPKVARLIGELESRTDLITTKLSWSSGIVIAIKARKQPQGNKTASN